MPPEDFARLVDSIREDGLMDPITVWQGQVIDGRHRYAACAEAGVERRFEYLGDDADPLRYILASQVDGSSGVVFPDGEMGPRFYDNNGAVNMDFLEVAQHKEGHRNIGAVLKTYRADGTIAAVRPRETMGPVAASTSARGAKPVGTTCGAIWTKAGGPSSPTSSWRRRPPDGPERKAVQICTVLLPRGKRPSCCG